MACVVWFRQVSSFRSNRKPNMLRLLLLRFWPVFLPILLYLVWLAYARRKAAKHSTSKPGLLDGPWHWAVGASLVIGIFCFVFLGMSHQTNDGVYVPAEMQPDGSITAPRLEQKP